MSQYSRLRWAHINRDKDLDKKKILPDNERVRAKRKTKVKGTKTRDRLDKDTKDVLRDNDLKRN